MDRVFDPRLWSQLTSALGGLSLGAASSSPSSETLLPLEEKKRKAFNLKERTEHVFELSNEPESPSAEIIFFHGLQLDSSSKPYITTWLSKDGNELWLNWLLEEFPDVRILVVSYDASIVETDDEGRLDMYLTCENLVQELMGTRQTSVGETGCPIILVGHCLGGLVLKELCVKVGHLMMTEEADCFKNFFRSVKGVFCYSTPHHGSELPDCSTSFARGSLFKDLNTLNAKIARRNEHFRKLRKAQNWRSEGVGESLEVALANFKGLIVPEGSSRHDVEKYYTINADHFNVCRPESTKSISYSMLAELIDQVIKKDKGSTVSQSDLPDTLVGLDGRIEEVQDRLRTESRIALVGMGGVGKTTLARAVYERIQKSFQYACFYGEVKVSAGPRESAKSLRDKIMAMFVDRRGQEVNISWNELKGKKVLIVLDDTILREQIKVMTTEDGFSPESRLIITARDRGFIKRANMRFYIHSVEVLDFEKSKELFCRCAFGEKESPPGFFEDVKKVVTKCAGLPLALTVTGGFLSSKRRVDYEEAFKRLKAAESLSGDAEDGLWSLLTVSYESLAAKEKEMFLDVATVFHGERLEEIQEVWKFSDGGDNIGWGNLLERHLLREEVVSQWPYDGKARVFMHELLRELGKRIAGPSRMYVGDLKQVSNEEAKVVKVLRGKLDDFDGSLLYKFSKLRVLWVDILWVDIDESDEKYATTMGDVGDESDENTTDNEKAGYNQGKRMEPIPSTLMDSSALSETLVARVRLKNGGAILRNIVTMKSLRLLKLEGVSPAPRFPDTFWTKIGDLEKLEALHFLKCDDLDTIPATIGQLKNLQWLTISACRKLREIPAEIGQLKNLQSLTISDCHELRKRCHGLREIPAEIGQLKNLQSLTIDRCPELRAIPAEIGQLKNLQSLDMHQCYKLIAIPAEIGQLKNLQSLNMSLCFELRTIPAEIGQLKNLQSLDFASCYRLSVIPAEIGQLKSLQSLTISECNDLREIPAEIGHLKDLQSLNMCGCFGLRTITAEIGQLKNLQTLDMDRCSGLRVIPAEIGQLKKLQSLTISGCYDLGEIPAEISQLKNLLSLDMHGCSELRAIPAEIGQLKNLQFLNITLCTMLGELPAEIQQLKCDIRRSPFLTLF